MLSTRSRNFASVVNDNSWLLYPNGRHSSRILAITVFGGIAMLAGGFILDFVLLNDGRMEKSNYLFAVLGSVISLFLWALGAWVWTSRNVPLCIDRNTKSIHMRGKQIVKPGALIAVVVKRPPTPDDGNENYSIFFETASGSIVSIPSPLFAWIGNESETRFWAEQMATALESEVIQTA